MKNTVLGKITYKPLLDNPITVSSNPFEHSNQEYKAKAAQLVIGLKFHYGKTLEELPLEVAIESMVKVWESCHPASERPTDFPTSNRPGTVPPPKTIHL